MESYLKSTPPCLADKLPTSNILLKFKIILQKRRFDYRNLSIEYFKGSGDQHVYKSSPPSIVVFLSNI